MTPQRTTWNRYRPGHRDPESQTGPQPLMRRRGEHAAESRTGRVLGMVVMALLGVAAAALLTYAFYGMAMSEHTAPEAVPAAPVGCELEHAAVTVTYAHRAMP